MSMTAVRAVAAAAAAAATFVPLNACGTENAADTRRHISVPSSAATGATAIPQSAATRGREDDMRIHITLGDHRLSAALETSEATRDLLDLLPVTIEMTDHGGVEKTGRLPASLSLEGQPAGADPDVGHIGYYAPGNDLVLYYGDQSYYDGIVLLGQLDGDAAERVAALDGSVSATLGIVDSPTIPIDPGSA